MPGSMGVVHLCPAWDGCHQVNTSLVSDLADLIRLVLKGTWKPQAHDVMTYDYGHLQHLILSMP